MLAVQTDFSTRAEEVNRYFQFLREFDEARVVFKTPASSPLLMSPADQSALLKTLKANGFLLLYNLVESTLKNAIEAIFDELKIRGVSFDSCRDEIRKIALKNLKGHNVEEILPSLSSISVDIVVETFRKDRLFSGNIDARRVRDLAADYGFTNPSRKSDELLTVKTNRNDLAHGVKSFADVGRDYDVVRLQEIRAEVVTFLEEMLHNVATYITSRDYLSASSKTAAASTI